MKPTLVRSTKVVFALVGLMSFFISSCGDSKEDSPTSQIDQRMSPDYNGPQELSYCDTTKTYQNHVVITGTAQFKKREVTSSGLGGPGPAIAIRHAEIRVTDSKGNVIQCSETDNLGNFSLELPNDSNTYKISVNARADNDKVKISVLDAPERNKLYSLSTSVKTNRSQSVGTLVASATGDILGAAFNIYDLILIANDYLRDQLGNCSNHIDNCADFTVAPKITAYWEKGFNPNSYVNEAGGS